MDDPNPELRQRVLGLLAREKDGYAQKRLLEGLENPAKALLPPEKALQLLGYDVHADAYRLARKIVDKPPSEIAKREALRLLAADTSAKPVFEKILSDKNEAPDTGRSRRRRCMRSPRTLCSGRPNPSSSTARSPTRFRRRALRPSRSSATTRQSRKTTS